jgi:hypothetical protein
MTKRRGREHPPTHCTHPKGCPRRVYARGLCLRHLKAAARKEILLREFLPSLPGHRYRTCVGKPGCRRNAILFGRCPPCLWEWQQTLKNPRRFL